jgi:hypothetical protein
VYKILLLLGIRNHVLGADRRKVADTLGTTISWSNKVCTSNHPVLSSSTSV